MVRVYLKKRRDNRIESGHPWVYRSEIARMDGECQPGDIVTVISDAGHLVGKGYINLRSQITVRILTRKDENIDRNFFEGRIRDAISLRQTILDDHTDSCRLIHAESDRLPALIVDKYGDYLVVQCLSAGMEVRKKELMEILQDVMKPKGIYERSDANVRNLEGLPQVKGLVSGQVPRQVEIRENGFRFMVDIQEGQKTGYFFDQRENRKAIQPFVSGKRVLDGFSYVGSFAVHAAGYGAGDVLAVDISPEATELGKTNAALNGFPTIRFETANVFDLLKTMDQEKVRFDVVLLDPPAFTKNKDSVPGALRGYKEINLRGMKLLESGGYLVTSSCSHHVSEEMFQEMLLDAARDARREVQIIEKRSQGKDHPVLLASRETQYLKFFMLRVF